MIASQTNMKQSLCLCKQIISQISTQKIFGKIFFMDTLKEVEKIKGGVYFCVWVIMENIF